MKTETSQYEFSHGRKPRGKGRWGFEITATDGDGGFLTETVFQYGTVKEAVAAAKQKMKNECGRIKTFISVEILP